MGNKNIASVFYEEGGLFIGNPSGKVRNMLHSKSAEDSTIISRQSRHLHMSTQ